VPAPSGELRARLDRLRREAEGVTLADLPARRASAVDEVVRGSVGEADVEGMALAAVGGYGRGELWPGSDLDLVLLHAPGDERRAEEAFERILYPLWDAGRSVGHAVRTVAECRAEADRNLRSLTALLDVRLLAGDVSLVDAVRQAAFDVVSEDPGEFLAKLREDRVGREPFRGRVGEALEPNLKDGLGGLRDAQALAWAAKAGACAPPTSGERADARFLGAVREALHLAAEAPTDRLGTEVQARVADLLGMPPEPGWEPRDVLMRRVAEAGRRLEAVVTAALDPDAPAGRIAPSATLRDFVSVAERGGSVSVNDLRGAAAARTSGGRWSGDVAGDLVPILAAGDGGARTVGLLDRMGLLDEVLPEWADVRGRPQRDPYHRFPVDTHLVQTAANAARLLFRPDEPFALQAVAMIRDPAAVLLGALLHDMGKVGRGSHVEAGTARAGAIVQRWGLDPATGSEVVFLVREHLLLSDTATRRDLEDEDLVLRVAARIEDPRRLAMLYLLTVADARATGPAAATPWRMGLVRDLVAKLQRVFDHGDMDRDRSARLTQAEADVRSAIRDSGATPAAAEGFLAAVPPGYLLWVDPAEAPGHLRMVDPVPGPAEVRTTDRPGPSGVSRLTLAARDRPGLLASVAGSLTLAGLSVHAAQVFTTATGVALDQFEVAGAFEPAISPERWRRFRTTLRRALEGRVDVRDRIERLRQDYRPARTDLPVTVRLDHEASDFHTVVEVGAPDRLGILFELTRTLADQGLDVHVAKVATYGPRVVDVFYVSTADGAKLTERARAAALEAALHEAAGG
jgi:[protein-PII] uridylyltransferase